MPAVTLALLHAQPVDRGVAISRDRIVAVADSATIGSLTGPGARIVDCHGLSILPGLIDAHTHILAAARSAAMLDCSCGSIEQLVAAVRTHRQSLPGGAWLRGRGYHEANLRERRQPTRRDLDRVAADIPVRLTHVTGHASVLNSIALAQLGIDAATEEPPGGSIEREEGTGEPSGVLTEMEDWLDLRMPPQSTVEMEQLVFRFGEALLSAGVTSVQDLGHRNDRRRADLLAGLASRGLFRPRITIATGYDAFAAGEPAIAEGLGRGPVKIMLNESGADLYPDDQKLARMVRKVHRAGRQVAIHAIETRAISAALDAIEAAQMEDGRSCRHRVEHAAITPPSLMDRMGRLGVVAVTNPAFLCASGDRYLQTVPPGALPYLYDAAGLSQRLGRHGINAIAGGRLAAGSDAPVGPYEPSIGISAAINRLTKAGRRLPRNGPRLDIAAALDMYTQGAAFATFEEQEKGAVRPRMLADLVVASVGRDYVRPVVTILGGEIVWEAVGTQESGPSPDPKSSC